MNRHRNEIVLLQEAVAAAERIVFFGGAGVSTESDIPDFRSQDGIYQQKEWPYAPEVMLSHSFFTRHPGEFFAFYRSLIFRGAQPNDAHLKLAQWEREGKLLAVITQNIDGLHQAAGSKTVYELHGSVERNFCQRCHAFYGADYILAAADIPHCATCGGIVKPDVVLYEECLDQNVMAQAAAAIADADLLIVGGTSLVVYPAAGMLRHRRGGTLALVNRDATAVDGEADIVIHGSIGAVFRQLP